MQTRDLTDQAFQALHALAQRYNVSVDAVRTLLNAVAAGNGTMAQFYHPELGGGGQWMQGGMTMVGDMFNSGLQSTVAGLCSELSNLLASQPVFAPPPMQAQSFNNFWPAELGVPSSSGAQNDARYAYFPQARRLVIERSGHVTVYDTLDHQIGGVQQQQGGAFGTLSFTSQRGTFTVESLPLASQPAAAAPMPPPSAAPVPQPPAAAPISTAPAPLIASPDHREIFEALDKLGDLRDRGILTDDEFRAKKTELLSRL